MPNYRPAVPLISNHNTCETIRTRCEMGKHKPLSLDTHKYKTTFTSTTKIELRFSRYYNLVYISDCKDINYGSVGTTYQEQAYKPCCE
jgi:hypothetical protein